MPNFSIKEYEEIEKKIEHIKTEMQGIKLFAEDKHEQQKLFNLARLAGKEEALRWVMGRGIIWRSTCFGWYARQ